MSRPALVLPRVTLAAVAAAVVLPVVAGGAASAAAADVTGPGPSATATAARPNVLVIKTDDQVMDDLTRMKQYMPQTAAWFAENGREFSNSYVSSPSCCQSRASTFVGRYPHNEGVWSQGLGATLDTRGALAPYLQRAGYRTGIVGKYLNLVYSDIPGYDWSTTIRGACEGAQTEDCSGTSSTNWYYNFKVTTNGKTDRAAEYVVAGDPITGAGYNTHWSGNRVRQYLGSALAGQQDTGRPWYVEWDPTAPHTHNAISSMPEPKYQGMPVPGCQPPVELDRTDKPAYVQAFSDKQAVQARKVICPAAQRTLRSVDDEFAAMLYQLRQAGQLSNTLIVFTSDNGLMNGEHLMSRKYVPYEPSVRVPLLISWPGHVAVGKDTRLVSNIDILPTVLQATGVPRDPYLPTIDGRSLLKPGGHTALLSEYRNDPGWANPNPVPIPTWAALTDGRSKYVETYTDRIGTVIGFREYYDLVRDPGELTNLLADGDPGNDPDVAALHDDLTAQRTCAGAGAAAPRPCA